MQKHNTIWEIHASLVCIFELRRRFYIWSTANDSTIIVIYVIYEGKDTHTHTHTHGLQETLCKLRCVFHMYNL